MGPPHEATQTARMNRLSSRIALLALLAACGTPVEAPDAGAEQPLDAGGATRDAGAEVDGGSFDAGVRLEDAGTTDAGLDAGTTLDGGPIDAGLSLDDAGATLDAGPGLDAGAIDAGGSLDDAGTPLDAGPGLDAGLDDAGVALDAGLLDAGLSFDGGAGCTQAAECASGFCVDGVCCDSACGGLCESCALPGRVGTCDATPAGADPDDDCATQPASTCGTTGVCSGQRTCQRWTVGSVCQAAFCSGASSQLADTCDGQGSCVDRGTQPCAPLTCDTASGLCRTSCSAPSHCASGFTCLGGVCKRTQGQTCMLGVECASGFCTDGICCESACAGTCERCSLSGRFGFCDPVPAGADIDSECATQAQSTCGTTGVCSGNRSCAFGRIDQRQSV